MRIGQTSAVVFVSKLLSSALGFAATLYLAQVVGPATLGIYFSTITIIAWLKLFGKFGISEAISKRISEGKDRSAYATTGLCMITVFALVLSVLILLFDDFLEGYVGQDIAAFVVVLLALQLGYSIVLAILKGERLVHVRGLLDPINIGVQSLVQIALVFASFGLAGMLVGYGVGFFVAGLVGLAFVSVGIERPRASHFRSLFEYAKFSWFGKLRNRTYQDIDILVLTALVPSALVGVYGIAWSLTNFLSLFGRSVSNTLFPEISRADANDDTDRVTTLLDDAIAFGGFILIPGFLGGAIVADRLLQIYGDKFVQGTTVLTILILGGLFHGYQKQFLNTINAIDRPDLAFRINIVFAFLNVVGNVGLVLAIGWTGAAIATAFSALVGLILSYLALQRLIEFVIPWGEISRQFAASLVMAAIVYGTRVFLERSALQHNVLIVLVLVGVGVAVYFLVLLGISKRFRVAIAANAPADIPYLTR